MIDGGLRKIFQDHLKQGFMWQSVETWSTGQGVPDVHYVSNGSAGWIECKLTTANAITFQPEQISWIERYARNGGRVFVAIRKCRVEGPRTKACDELHIYPGSMIRDLKINGLKLNSWLAYGEGGPARWPWDDIRTLLTA